MEEIQKIIDSMNDENFTGLIWELKYAKTFHDTGAQLADAALTHVSIMHKGKSKPWETILVSKRDEHLDKIKKITDSTLYRIVEEECKRSSENDSDLESIGWCGLQKFEVDKIEESIYCILSPRYSIDGLRESKRKLRKARKNLTKYGLKSIFTSGEDLTERFLEHYSS